MPESMNQEQFVAEIVKNRFDTCVNTLSPKGDEYTRNGDAFHVFKAVGAARNQTPEEALWGMYMKHWASVQNMINDITKNVNLNMTTAEMSKWIKAKIGDSINYHVLLEGLLMERVTSENIIAEVAKKLRDAVINSNIDNE